MIVQKLRLEKGWSQQQLAEMSGLSKRTIQRIENGKTPSVESVKSLAAVFEVDFLTLNGALTMNKNTAIDGSTNNNVPQEKALDVIHQNKHTVANLTLTDEEKLAYQKIRRVKKFYIKVFVFATVMSLLFLVNLLVTPETWWVQWVFLGWGIGLLVRGLKTFDFFPPLGVEWEKRQLEKYLRK